MATSLRDMQQLDSVIPGVSEAYASLRSGEGKGIYTSRGAMFHKTIFGRDAAMTAKFVVDFDHQAAFDTIVTLISLQGTHHNTLTQEEPGRIHHEWRDFRRWHGAFGDRLPFFLLRRTWDIRRDILLTYYSLDATALFIRLVHKYATHVDATVLERKVVDREGNPTTVKAAVAAAAHWLVEAIDDSGLVAELRHNTLSLPFQTFQDSFYSRGDGSLVVANKRIAFIEVQAFAADALFAAAHLFEGHGAAPIWREAGRQLFDTMRKQYRLSDGYFASAIDHHGAIDVPNISVGWILNVYPWRFLDDEERKMVISPIVRRLFSNEFLTPIGLRTRSVVTSDPVPGVVDYHGSETVWPMFTFMVIEGLRKHRLYDLARELEHRLITAYNAIPGFQEFYVISRAGITLLPQTRSAPRCDVQRLPEQQIAFSVVPAMVLAHRQIAPPSMPEPATWQRQLEQEVLSQIKRATLAQPNHATEAIGPSASAVFRRDRARFKIARYLYRNRASL